MGKNQYRQTRLLKLWSTLAAKAGGIWNVPTMAVMEVDLGLIDRHSLVSRPELEYMPRLQVQKWMKLYGDVIVKNLPPKEETEMIETNREELLRALNERVPGAAQI